MIDFSTLKGLTIPEGNVTQITDANGRVLWAVSGGKVVLGVEKITSDTYAGSTTYTGEQFILLDIYPKTNGTVSVTYGGLTKTITDTSGAEEPNAQQVSFGTFNGVSDDVETPASGKLEIEGDCVAFGSGAYKTDKSHNTWCGCIASVADFGNMTVIANRAFACCSKLISVDIPPSVKSIGTELMDSIYAGGSFWECTGLERVILHEGLSAIKSLSFYGCVNLASVVIPSTVKKIGEQTFAYANNRDCYVEVDSKNTMYKIDGNCLIDIESNTILSGFANSVIPSYIQRVEGGAFEGCASLASITIPASVTELDGSPFIGCTGLVSVIFENPSGWYVTTTKGGDLSTGTAVDVSDPANNATLLTETYAYHNDYWYRS